MKKVTMRTANLFSLKKYFDSHLNCRSYEYPMVYTLRSAILGAIIRLDGVLKAKELFPYVKNALIYLQYPDGFHRNQVNLRRRPNAFYSSKNKSDSLIGMGVREYVNVDKMVFYIDNTIPNIDIYIQNIEYIGNSQGLVFLESVEEVDVMENVLMDWIEEEDGDQYLFEVYDWGSGITFDHVYFYKTEERLKENGKPDRKDGTWYKRCQQRKICCMKPIVSLMSSPSRPFIDYKQ